jgi:hypothetical protein
MRELLVFLSAHNLLLSPPGLCQFPVDLPGVLKNLLDPDHIVSVLGSGVHVVLIARGGA